MSKACPSKRLPHDPAKQILKVRRFATALASVDFIEANTSDALQASAFGLVLYRMSTDLARGEKVPRAS